MQKFIGFLRLTRPANIVTAVADILAGIAIAGVGVSEAQEGSGWIWLILSTIGLYGGGVVMNDVFDADLDAVERPERPIPSGLVPIFQAATLGILLLAFGIFTAFKVSMLSGGLALAIAIAALVYDKWGKHHSFLGPLNMGICRGLNLLLGMSIVSTQVSALWYLSIVPIIYIAAITTISRGEVHGGKTPTLFFAAVLYVLAMAAILYVSAQRDTLVISATFLALWALMVFAPLQKAIRNPEGRMIGRAVKAGVLALILMNAAWASAFGAPWLALGIVLLLPLSILFAKAFAVT